MLDGPFLTLKAPILPFLTFFFIIFHEKQGLILHANHQKIGIKSVKVSKRWYTLIAYWHFRDFYKNNFKHKWSKDFPTDFILLVHMYIDHESNKKEKKQHTPKNYFDTYHGHIFCSENNIACSLRLLHIYRCTSGCFYHESKHYEP